MQQERRRWILRIVFMVALISAPIKPALSHPHVLVTARAEIVFDGAGAVVSVRHIWQFDEAFSAYAMQGLDANNDGVITSAELQPLAQINVESLAEYGFFTWLNIGGQSIELEFPEEYWLDVYDGRLTLFYKLSLAQPTAVTGHVILEVTDPEYFVAFSFADDIPIRLIDAPASCTTNYRPPQGLDNATAAQLAAIPADQRTLPVGLGDVADAIANIIRVDC
jgi:ABC-type uncharacterized transport system substrate-binding protein